MLHPLFDRDATNQIRISTEHRPITPWSGVKVFSSLIDHVDSLGDTITDWIRSHPQASLVEIVIAQSSDRESHCVSIAVFFNSPASTDEAVAEPK